MVLPAIALAAYNDVTLTTSTVLSVGGINLNISGSSATVQSIVVSGGNITATLLPGSSLAITSATKNQITQSGGTSYITSQQCDGNGSNMTFSYPSGAGSPATVVITPSATICTTSSSGGGGGGGGAGGGGGVITGPLSIGRQTNTPTQATSSASSGIVQTSSPSGSGLSAPPPVAVAAVFVRNLQLGSKGADVTALQSILIQKGFLDGTPSGYYGARTAAAVKKFQTAYNLSPLGTVGPQTRAILNQTGSGTTNTPSSTANPGGVIGDGYQFLNPLQAGSKGTDVIELQKHLIAEGLYTGSITGYYGAQTKTAVQAFQTKYGLQPLGTVGPGTRAALNKGL